MVMRVAFIALAFGCAASACGGRQQDLGDASISDGSADIVEDGDGEGADASGDAVSGYVFVDGGNACDPDSGGTAAYVTCCGADTCQGQCAMWLDGGGMFCECAGLTRGCPSGYLCCPGDNVEGTCTNQCPKTGTN
jgi:hypothetical protein